jgi:acetylornithine deacetylase/succinyl-diaminopimelate desuccinylase-like protein
MHSTIYSDDIMDVEPLLSKLVSIDSSFPNESRIGEFIEGYLKEEGMAVRRQYVSDGRFNIFAERKGSGRPILLYGHMDTVIPHGRWHTNPLKLERDGDRLIGLGACDMKGGLAAILSGLAASKGRSLKAVFCVDEENISVGGWKALSSNRKWFSGVSIALSGDSGHSEKYKGGADVITAGRRGRVVINIDVRGFAFHGAQPKKGINAIDEASKIVLGLGDLKLLKHKALGGETAFANLFEGRSTGLAIPESARIGVDLHLVPPDTGTKAKKRVEELVRRLKSSGTLDRRTVVDVSIAKRETPYIDPYETKLSDKSVRRVIRIVDERCGTHHINYGSSVADDNIISNILHVPVITIAPNGDNPHAENEWVSRKGLGEVASLYAELIERL